MSCSSSWGFSLPESRTMAGEGAARQLSWTLLGVRLLQMTAAHFKKAIRQQECRPRVVALQLQDTYSWRQSAP